MACTQCPFGVSAQGRWGVNDQGAGHALFILHNQLNIVIGPFVSIQIKGGAGNDQRHGISFEHFLLLCPGLQPFLEICRSGRTL